MLVEAPLFPQDPWHVLNNKASVHVCATLPLLFPDHRCGRESEHCAFRNNSATNIPRAKKPCLQNAFAHILSLPGTGFHTLLWVVQRMLLLQLFRLCYFQPVY